MGILWTKIKLLWQKLSNELASLINRNIKSCCWRFSLTTFFKRVHFCNSPIARPNKASHSSKRQLHNQYLGAISSFLRASGGWLPGYRSIAYINRCVRFFQCSLRHCLLTKVELCFFVFLDHVRVRGIGSTVYRKTGIKRERWSYTMLPMNPIPPVLVREQTYFIR